jgi:hypothetical protein
MHITSNSEQPNEFNVIKAKSIDIQAPSAEGEYYDCL